MPPSFWPSLVVSSWIFTLGQKTSPLRVRERRTSVSTVISLASSGSYPGSSACLTLCQIEKTEPLRSANL